MIIGIDIGSHKIVALMGEGLPGGGVRVVGAGHAPAEGIRAGEVVSVEDAAGAIGACVERAERLAGDTFDTAVIGVTGAHVVGAPNRAAVPCGRRPRPMDASDVERVLEVAGTVPIEPEREVLHILPRSYRLDGGSAVDSPIGMEGFRLEAEVHIVTGSLGAFNTVRRCLKLADIDRYRMVMSTLAAAEATVTPDERELGVVVVDLGHALTGVACFADGAIVHTGTLKVGGKHLTNDLAVLFQTPFEQAERLKKTHGHVLPEHDDDRAEVDIVPFGEEQVRTVRRRDVSRVLAARADEMAAMILSEIERAGFGDHPPAGVVLVGGGTELKGLPHRLQESWRVPVRVGRPTQVAGLTNAAKSPDHAAAVGLLMWAARGVPDAAVPNASANGHSVPLSGMFGWMRDTLLPRRDGRRG